MAIGLLNLADDEGYFYADPKLVRSALRSFDDDSTITRECLDQLSAIGYIEIREHSTHGLVGRVISFSKHQRVDRPSPSLIKGFFDSTNARRTLDDDSLLEGKGKEQGKERNNTPLIPQGGDGGFELGLFPPEAVKQTPERTPDDFVEFWNEHDFVAEARMLTPKRKQLLKKRLEEDFFMRHVDEALEIASTSRFLRGEVKPSPGHKRFKLTIDWFLHEENFVKILEGHYSNPGPDAAGSEIKYYHPERQTA